MESAQKPAAPATAGDKATPMTSKLADLLMGLKESDAAESVAELKNQDHVTDISDSCNCRKSRCLKLCVNNAQVAWFLQMSRFRESN